MWFSKYNKHKKEKTQKTAQNESDILKMLDSELRAGTWVQDATSCLAVVGSDNYTTDEKKRYIEFIIDGLVREMAGFYAYRTNEIKDIALQSLLYFPYATNQKLKEATFTITSETLIPFPWSPVRIIDSMKDVEEKGYQAECETAKGIFFEELNLVVLNGHNHHVAAAVTKKQTKGIVVRGPIIRFAEVEDNINLTADFHFADSEGKILQECSDPRFVLACYLAQKLHKLSVASTY